MNEEFLYELLHFEGEYDLIVGMPNELFKELKILIDTGKLKKQHIGFAYSYIYLQTYLYRYAKYEKFVPSPSDIKTIFGYRPDNKTIDYIIKKNGVLEKDVNILVTTNDFPISVGFEDDASLHKELLFTKMNDIKDDEFWKPWIVDWRNNLRVTNRSTCKLPVFGFNKDYRNGYNDEYFDGSFYITEDLTLLDFRVFAYCMSKPDELGSNAFYLYSYFKHENFKTKGDFKATRDRIVRESLLSDNTVRKYMSNMRSYKMIDTIHNMEYFSLGWEKKEREASNHQINEYDKFTSAKTEYAKLYVVDRFTHLMIMKDKKYKEKCGYKADIGLDELPY